MSVRGLEDAFVGAEFYECGGHCLKCWSKIRLGKILLA